MSLFTPTWHTEKAGVNALGSEPEKPEKAFSGLFGEESKSIYPRFPLSAPNPSGTPGRLLAFDEERRLRHEARAARTAAALAERFCEACGFSFWRVTSRGDASCYACDLIREGRPLRCAACGGEEWCRDEHGRRACATCAGGDTTTAAAPLAFARPEASSREVSEPGGAA